MTSPHFSLGNEATDISSGAANFAQGLMAEKDRKRQEALQAALAALQERRVGIEQEQTDVAKQHEMFGENQFEQMLPLYQRQTAAEEIRAQAALRAASSRMNVARHQQLTRELQTAQKDLAQLRQLDLQQKVASQNPRVAALRQAGMLPPETDYSGQMSNAQQRFDDAIDALQNEEGVPTTPRVGLPAGGTPAPTVPHAAPAPAPAAGGVAAPRVGPQVVQPIVPSDPTLRAKKAARWQELTGSGMQPDAATQQVEREFPQQP